MSPSVTLQPVRRSQHSEEACEVQVTWSESSAPSSSGFHRCVTCRSDYGRPPGRAPPPDCRRQKGIRHRRGAPVSRSLRCHGADVSEAWFCSPRREQDRGYQRTLIIYSQIQVDHAEEVQGERHSSHPSSHPPQSLFSVSSLGYCRNTVVQQRLNLRKWWQWFSVSGDYTTI